MKKIIKRFLSVVLCLLVLLSTATAGLGILKAHASETQNAMFLFKNTLYVTCNVSNHAYNSSYPYRKPIDIIDNVSGNGNAYAPFDCKVVAKSTSNGNTVAFESTSKVKFANGTVDYVTFMVAHDDNISNISIGNTYSQGSVIYQEGNAGTSSGSHIHLEVARGAYSRRSSSSQSIWSFVRNQSNVMYPHDVFFLYEGTSIKNAGGYSWKYEPDPTFTVTYDANGGIDAPASETDSIITISRDAPYKFGYNFIGWSESRTASSAEYSWRSTLFEVRDRYLYAVWETPTAIAANTNISTTIDYYDQYVFYTFTPSSSGEYTFESSGGLDTLIYLYNSSQTLLGEDDDEGNERNFKLSANLTSGTKYYISIRAYSNNLGTSSFRITSNSHTLRYNANGGSGAPSSQSGATSYTISSTVPERFGYTFLGWSKNSSATTATYEPDDSISLASDTTLYAVWKSASNVSLNTNISTTIEFPYQQVYYTFTPSSSGEYTFESSGSLDSKITLYNSSGTEIGYNDDGSENRNFLLTEELSSGTRYYVKIWAYSDNSGSTTFRITKEAPTTYTLSYNANGGSGAPSSQSGATSYTISSTVPERFGYTFLGWSRSSSASLATYVGGNSITLTSDTTLYAVWQENTVTAYTLTYNANGGSGAPSPQSGATSYTVSSTEPTRSGYTFLGWSRSPSATLATYYRGDTITLTADTTLYAVWKTNVSHNTPEVHIRNNPGTRTINYGDIIHITAEVTNLPEGASIDWRISNDAVGLYGYLDEENEFSCYVKGTGTGSGYIVAVLVDADGNEILDENGNVIFDRQDFKVNGSFIQIIISFLKLIFGIERTIVQSVFNNNI